jgi:hypothetical protein
LINYKWNWYSLWLYGINRVIRMQIWIRNIRFAFVFVNNCIRIRIRNKLWQILTSEFVPVRIRSKSIPSGGATSVRIRGGCRGGTPVLCTKCEGICCTRAWLLPEQWWLSRLSPTPRWRSKAKCARLTM